MIIISIDPGQTSGYVVYDTEKDKVVTFGVLTGEHKAVIDFILQWKADIIVCEDFRPRPGMGHALANMRGSGVQRLLALSDTSMRTSLFCNNHRRAR